MVLFRIWRTVGWKIRRRHEKLKENRKKKTVNFWEVTPIVKMSRKRAKMTCPNCLMCCVPEKRYKFTKKTYKIMSYLAFGLLCWLPYVIKDMRCIIYFCPFCEAALGYSEVFDKESSDVSSVLKR